MRIKISYWLFISNNDGAVYFSLYSDWSRFANPKISPIKIFVKTNSAINIFYKPMRVLFGSINFLLRRKVRNFAVQNSFNKFLSNLLISELFLSEEWDEMTLNDKNSIDLERYLE